MLAVGLVGWTTLWAQEQPVQAIRQQWEKCLICHGKPELKKVLESGRVISLFVDADELAQSVHASRRCEECHTDIVTIPHKGRIKKVDCRYCHYVGSPYDVPKTERYQEYEQSVHARAVAAGREGAPVCQDCHGDHDVQPAEAPNSPVYRTNLPENCGRCHLKEFAAFSRGIHGRLLAEGNPDAPSCGDCHGEHLILSPKNPVSPIYPAHIPDTCSKCHGSKTVVGKYGLSPDLVRAYRGSFHGIATQFGETRAANCASCHDYHEILPPENPRSPVHVSNIPKTCGKCHPGANENYAKGKIHVEPQKRESGLVFWISLFFKYFTITVIFGLVVHIMLDLNRRLRRKRI